MQNLPHLQWAVMTQGCSQTHGVRLFMHSERGWELPWDPETSCLLTLGKPPSHFTVHRCQPASLPSLAPWSHIASSTQIQNCGHLRMLFDLKLSLPIKGFFLSIHIVNKTAAKINRFHVRDIAKYIYVLWTDSTLILLLPDFETLVLFLRTFTLKAVYLHILFPTLWDANLEPRNAFLKDLGAILVMKLGDPII